MTITPIEGGYLMTLNYKGRTLLAECDTPEECWLEAVEWMECV